MVTNYFLLVWVFLVVVGFFCLFLLTASPGPKEYGFELGCLTAKAEDIL